VSWTEILTSLHTRRRRTRPARTYCGRRAHSSSQQRAASIIHFAGYDAAWEAQITLAARTPSKDFPAASWSVTEAFCPLANESRVGHFV